jgi:hypothetical protein
MPYKTSQVDAEMFLCYNGVEVHHCYTDDDVEQPLREYHYVLNAELNEDESFDIRDLSTWSEDKSKHQVLKQAIDKGELKPYKPLD